MTGSAIGTRDTMMDNTVPSPQKQGKYANNHTNICQVQ